MPIRVYHNINAITVQRNLGNNRAALGSSLEKLSSGMRINKAGDDAAGLAISEFLRADIRSMGQAIRNANDGVSMINTAEGALSEQSSILIRMRELATQSATGSLGSTERSTINREFTALRDEINRISATSEFNGQTLIDGGLSSATGIPTVVIQIGIHAGANYRINLNTAVDLTAINASALQIDALNVTAATAALSAIARLDSALVTVVDGRGRLGATQNRLQHTLQSLSVASQNLQAAESQIRDADYAKEISKFTKNQILSQASTSILAQANLVPQQVLQLLR